MDDDRNMPEDNDIGPFEFENDKNEPDHPRAWVVDRGEYQHLPVMYTEEEMEKAFSAGWDVVNNEQPRKFRFNDKVKQKDWDNWWSRNKKK